MSERARFFNRRAGDTGGDYTYSADDFAEYLNTFFSDGVVGSCLRIYSVGNRIVVPTGYAIIAGHWYNNDTIMYLTNPVENTEKRKDSIALKLDKDERTINAVWVAGSASAYPTLTSSDSIKYLKLADIEMLAGGVIKAVDDKRTYSKALYTMSLQEFNQQWDLFLKTCNSQYDAELQNIKDYSEIIKSRGGYSALPTRLDIADSKFEAITEPGTANLYDRTKSVVGVLNNYGGISSSDTNYYTTDFIPFPNGTSVYFYDRTGNPVTCETCELYRSKSANGLIRYDNSGVSSVINNCNAKYIRVSFEKSIIAYNNLQITNSDIPPTYYIDYKLIIKPELVPEALSALHYITDTITLTPNELYTISESTIANNSPILITISGGGGNTVLQRADNTELIDQITGEVINSTMTKVEITATDVISGILLTQGGTLNVTYYSKECENLIAELNQLKTNFSIDMLNLQARYSKVSGKNIFDSDSIVEGEYINWGNGAIQTHADYFYTENAIEVEPNTTYTGSWYNLDGTFNSVMTAFVLFYNSLDEFISGVELNNSANGVFTTPANCHYIRYSGKLSTWNNLLLQIEKGYTRSDSYEAYYNSVLLKPEHIPIDFIKGECNKKSYIYVDKSGNGDYTTITEAVTNVEANAEGGTTIVVAPGIYDDEKIEAWGKEVHIVGVSREACIITNSTADYSTPPVEIGKGSLENLTIIAAYGTGVSTHEKGWFPYAVHTEDNNLSDGELTVTNCTFISELNAAFGLGMRGGCTVTIRNSQLIGRKGENNKALYFHDADSVAYAGVQNINIVNSLLESDKEASATVRIDDRCIDGSSMVITMINTVIFNSGGAGSRLGTTNRVDGTYDGWRNLKNTTLSPKSFGNNIDAFNSQ